MSNSVRPHGLQPTRLLCPWDFPGKNAGVGCHALLQGSSPIQGSNLHLVCLQQWQAGSLGFTQNCCYFLLRWASLTAQMVKNLPAVQDAWVWFLDGKIPGGGHGNPLQYSHLENPRGQRCFMGSVHGVAELDMTAQLSTAQHLLRYLIKLTIEAVCSKCVFIGSCVFLNTQFIISLFSLPESAFFFAIAQIFSLITSFLSHFIATFLPPEKQFFMPQLSAGFKITFQCNFYFIYGYS